MTPAMTKYTDSLSVSRFEDICKNTLVASHEKKGIGTLGERTLHVILKNFYESDAAFHEVKTGRFTADIKRGCDIVEIQTRAFRNLREKLPVLLEENTVKVVFPIAEKKYITWIDPQSGEMSERRKSPKSGSIWDMFLELWEIRKLLPSEGLSFDAVYLEIEEYKFLTGRSRDKKHYGAVRAERIPTKLLKIETYESAEDFKSILPKLPSEFTVAEFKEAAKLKTGFAGKIISTLATLGVIEKCGERKRAYLYKIT